MVLHNAARVAEVWMDEWGEFYYAMNPGSIELVLRMLMFCFEEFGDLFLGPKIVIGLVTSVFKVKMFRLPRLLRDLTVFRSLLQLMHHGTVTKHWNRLQ